MKGTLKHDMQQVQVTALLLMLLSLPLVWSCSSPSPVASDDERATQIARDFLEGQMPTGVLDRSTVEVRPSRSGWMVVFRDVNVSCDQAHWGPDLCGMPAPGISTPVPSVFRDLFVCVDSDLSHLGSVGGAISSLDSSDRCAARAPAQAQATATP